MGQEVRGVPEAAALRRRAFRARRRADAPAPGAAEAGGTPEAPIGRYLARQRALRGVSLDALAELTKIPRRSLERLEAGAFDHQADGFVRGFVRTVAEALGLDPNEAVMRLLGEPPDEEPELPPTPGLGRRQIAAAAALGIGLAAAAGVVWALVRVVTSPGVPGEPTEIVTRPDAVRALAERERTSPPKPD